MNAQSLTSIDNPCKNAAILLAILLMEQRRRAQLMTLITSKQNHLQRRITMLIGLIAFLFHAMVPYLHGAVSASEEGYTTTVCTAYGYQQLFVALNSGGEEQQDLNTTQLKVQCPTCTVQAHASGWMDLTPVPMGVCPPQAVVRVGDGGQNLVARL
ncbi:MAG TPA: hypothetical protein HPP72_04245, partial [Gammaproteobacteria bacterium]|nr:hypothetical protein [Gammaproteobacteria bacterium]